MLQFIPLITFFLAVLTCWTSCQTRHLKVWEIFAAASLLFALLLDQITLLGVAFIITPFFLLRNRTLFDSHATLFDLFFGLYFLVMLFRLLPGFPDTVILDQQTIGRAQTPFGITLNFSIPYAGLLFLAFLTHKATTLTILLKTLFSKSGLFFWLILPVMYFVPGLLLGVKPDVKFLAITPLALACNLFFTVIPEEVFFRGFLQTRIQRVIGPFTLLLTPILFALFHVLVTNNTSVAYFIVVLLAGSMFSFVYYRSNRIEIPVAAHFMVNAIHFVFFPYPY